MGLSPDGGQRSWHNSLSVCRVVARAGVLPEYDSPGTTQAVEHFGFWRAKRHPFSQGVTPSEVEEFLTSHLSRCHCPQPAVTTLEACRPALNRLMTMLGCRKPSARSDEETGAVGTLIRDFDQHLAKVCGLSAATRIYRRRYAREFLAWRFKGKGPDLAELCFADFLSYVKVKAPTLKPASVGVMITALRSLVRFWEFRGYCRSGLSRAWPKMPNWKRSPPLDILTPQECRDLLRVVNRNDPSGRRDLAILRLIVDLGLRCTEVAELLLEDIDWRSGTLAIRKNKQRRERLLPLLPLVGKTILNYLRNGRPKSSSRQLFLCHRLPVGQPITPGGFVVRFAGRCSVLVSAVAERIDCATPLPRDCTRGEPLSKRSRTSSGINISIQRRSMPE